MTSPPHDNHQKSPQNAVLAPSADPAFASIVAPEIRHRVRIAHAVHHLRNFNQAWIGRPVGHILLNIWLRNWPGARLVEKKGLPRHSVTDYLGAEALILHVNPRELVQFAEYAPKGETRRPSSMAFIWDGDWDLRRSDLRVDYWIAHMRDLDENRHHLERTRKFKSLMADLEAGKPFRSHQEGVYLNSRQRILDYLAVYLGFLDNMAEHGYDTTRAKDNLGVVISREGRILKINRGLHRLAMAQWLGLPSIQVQVRHIHRFWWEQIVQNTRGQEALQRISEALHTCHPEQDSGPLTEHPPASIPDDFWPPARYTEQAGSDRNQTSNNVSSILGG